MLSLGVTPECSPDSTPGCGHFSNEREGMRKVGPLQSLSPKQGAKLRHASSHPPQHPTTAQDGKQCSHGFLFQWNTKTVLHQTRAGRPCAFYKADYRGQMKEADEVKLHFKLPSCFRWGRCFVLYSLRVHHRSIRILRNGMYVAKLALKGAT